MTRQTFHAQLLKWMLRLRWTTRDLARRLRIDECTASAIRRGWLDPRLRRGWVDFGLRREAILESLRAAESEGLARARPPRKSPPCARPSGWTPERRAQSLLAARRI